MRNLICQNCGKEFGTNRKFKVVSCSKECAYKLRAIRTSITKTCELSESRKQELFNLLSLGYCVGYKYVKQKLSYKLSARVYFRYLELFEKDHRKVCRHLPGKVQSWDIFEFARFLKSARTKFTTDLPNMFGLDGKTVGRLLEYYNIPKKRKWPGYKMGKMTKPEKECADIITSLGLTYVFQKKVGKFYFDFCVNSVLVEVHGDYWHCNPDIYPKPINDMQRNNKKNDCEKALLANKLGYELYVIWENDLKKDKENVERKLRYVLC